MRVIMGVIKLAILLIIIGIAISFVNYSRAQTRPTRTWIPNPGICQEPATNCFDDVVIEPPK